MITRVCVPAVVGTVTSRPRLVVRVCGVTGAPSSTAVFTVAPAGQRVADRELGHGPADLHARAVGLAGVRCLHRGRAAVAEADRRAAHTRLTLRHLRHDLERAPTEVRAYAELLVHDRPRGAVVAPGLQHHRPLGELAVELRRVVAGRRHDLRHRAGLLVGVGQLHAAVGRREALLLVLAEAAVVALADGHDRGVQRERLLLGRHGRLGGVAARVARVEEAEVVAVALRLA